MVDNDVRLMNKEVSSLIRLQNIRVTVGWITNKTLF